VHVTPPQVSHLLKAHVIKVSWASCLFFLLSHEAMAQTIPSAGGQMQQVPTVPTLPAPSSALPELLFQQPLNNKRASNPQASTFVATRLQVTGTSIYAQSELVKISGFESGHALNFAALVDMADKITQRYRRDGFLVARAYLPAQEIKDGLVTITVLEGQYGQVQVNNTSSLKPALPSNVLSSLHKGDVIASAPLEERLLLLSDVPGVQVRSSLVPGASVGLSDLIVEVKPGARISGSLDADNAGNRYTGENRIGVTLNLNNPTDRGDVITLRGFTSGAGLQYVRAAYQTPIGRGRMGAAFSELNYALGHEFKALNAHGQARIATLFGNFPVLRSRNANVNMGLSLDSKLLQDRADAIPSVNDKRVQVATASLYGDHKGASRSAGVSRYSLAWSLGNLHLQTATARAVDANTALSQGTYSKLAFAVSRLQPTPIDRLSLFASLSGQVASKNLDVSEKMALGGMYGVRAYPEGEAYADAGYLLTLEVRQQLSLPVTDQVHMAAFVDTGVIKLNQSPWMSATNTRHLSGAGVGLYWTRSSALSVRMFYARKLGDGVALSAPDKSGRFWVQAVTYF
jgi:hemolysin activation/secretion protein